MSEPKILRCNEYGIQCYQVTLNEKSVFICDTKKEVDDLVNFHKSLLSEGFTVDGNAYTDPITLNTFRLFMWREWCLQSYRGELFYSMESLRKYQIRALEAHLKYLRPQMEAFRIKVDDTETALKQLESRVKHA